VTAPILHKRADAAAILGVSDNWLKMATVRREVPFTKMGARIFLWSDEQIAEIARSRAVPAAVHDRPVFGRRSA
jgi:hypothetical protein